MKKITHKRYKKIKWISARLPNATKWQFNSAQCRVKRRVGLMNASKNCALRGQIILLKFKLVLATPILRIQPVIYFSYSNPTR